MATPKKWGGETTVTSNFFDLGAGISLGGGRFAVFGNYSNDIGVQFMNADGTRSGTEAVINTNTAGAQGEAEAATLISGNYVVVWDSMLPPTFEDRLKGQIYNSSGVKVGTEFAFGAIAGAQRDVGVTALTNGQFVTHWQNDPGGVGTQVKAQIFTAAGVKSGAEITVNAPVDNDTPNSVPQISALSGGRFVAVWTCFGPLPLGDTTGSGIFGQIFNANGTKSGAEFLVNTFTGGNEVSPSVAVLANGTFVVTYVADNDGDPSPPPGRDPDTGLYQQLFSAAGAKIGGEQLVHVVANETPGFPEVVALKDGRYCIAWMDTRGAGTPVHSLRGQLFNANGTKSGSEFQVNTTPLKAQAVSGEDEFSVTVLSDGRLSFTYQTDFVSPIHSQIFDPREAGITLNGGAGNDFLAGTDFNDILTGAGGNDIIDARGGNDRLNGGAGIDQLRGGLGNDTFVLGADTTDIITDSGGNDTMESTINRVLAAGSVIENITLLGAAAINATGNGVANKLTGNAGSNMLVGGLGNDVLDGGSAGADQLKGGAGDDTYVLGARTTGVTITEVSGNDTISSTISRVLAAGSVIENITLTGAGNFNATGNTGANKLTGNSGNNILNGGASGTDVLNGGLGNDTYVIGARVIGTGAGQVHIIDSGGIDTISSSVTRVLAAGPLIENLTLTGTANINGTGNGLANIIHGNSGNNILNGGADNVADQLFGGLGNDTYVIGQGGDYVDDAGGNADTVTSMFSLDLFYYVDIERLTLLGNGNINGFGDSGNNVITGNSGNNTLTGFVAGDDTFSDDDDELHGGGGDDKLYGGLGNDALDGDSGNDTLTGGIGNDIFGFIASSHTVVGAFHDVITDFISGIDRIDVSRISQHEVPGGAKFKFIADAAFSSTGKAELRTIKTGANSDSITQGDVNGDGVADFEIFAAGAGLLSSGDFVI